MLLFKIGKQCLNMFLTLYAIAETFIFRGIDTDLSQVVCGLALYSRSSVTYRMGYHLYSRHAAAFLGQQSVRALLQSPLGFSITPQRCAGLITA